MKRNTHAIVPEGRFRLLAGNDHLSCYQANWGLEEGCFGQASPEGSAGDNLSRCQCNCFLISTSHLGCPPLANRLPSPALQFNTHTARHLFCKTCGICPFYRPRSNPDGYAGKAPGDMGRGCVAQCSRATSMRAKQQSSRRAAQQRKRLNLPAPPPSPPPSSPRAVTVHCLRPGTVRSITMKHIAGSNWESVVAASGIQQLSSVDG